MGDLREIGLAHRQGQATQIITVEREIVEGIELDFIVMLPGMLRIEVGDTIDAEHHRLTINDELLVPVLQRGPHDPRIARGPVITAASDQPDAIAVSLHQHAEALILDFVKPFGAGRNLRASDGEAELVHGQYIGQCRRVQLRCCAPGGDVVDVIWKRAK